MLSPERIQRPEFCVQGGYFVWDEDARVNWGMRVRENGVLAVTTSVVCPAECEDKSWGEGQEAPDKRAASLLMWGGRNEPCISAGERTRWKWWRRGGRKTRVLRIQTGDCFPGNHFRRDWLSKQLEAAASHLGSGLGGRLIPKDNQKHMRRVCVQCVEMWQGNQRHAGGWRSRFPQNQETNKKRKDF